MPGLYHATLETDRTDTQAIEQKERAMQLQEAVQLVQAKFVAETQGKTEGPEYDAYYEAIDKFPVMIEVATYCWADQIVQQNYEMRKQQAAAQAGQAGGEAPQGTA